MKSKDIETLIYLAIIASPIYGIYLLFQNYGGMIGYSIAFLLICISLVYILVFIFEYFYYKSEKFLAIKNSIKENTLKCNELNAHRLGMCLNAQGGYFPAALSLGAGMLKEGKDIYCKAFDHKIGNIGNKVGLCNRSNPLSFGEAWDDSAKDMANNIEGIQYGLNNPQKSCRQWLNDLDYRNNRWRR